MEDIHDVEATLNWLILEVKNAKLVAANQSIKMITDLVTEENKKFKNACLMIWERTVNTLSNPNLGFDKRKKIGEQVKEEVNQYHKRFDMIHAACDEAIRKIAKDNNIEDLIGIEH